MKKALVIVVVVIIAISSYHIGMKIGRSQCDMQSTMVETFHHGNVMFFNPNPEIMETVYLFENEEVTVYWSD